MYQGGRAVAVAAPLERRPTFLREGGILPTQEAVQYVGEAAAGTLSVDLFAAAATGSFELYEDDGVDPGSGGRTGGPGSLISPRPPVGATLI